MNGGKGKNNGMKILIVNTYDVLGGAARAAFRLHEALSQNGIDSQMLVMHKESDIKSIVTPQITTHHNLFARLLKKARYYYNYFSTQRHVIKISNKWGPFSQVNIENKQIINAINSLNPDVVCLCWICAGMLAIEDLNKIKAPIVWCLHDMWSFTGGCHYVAEEDGVMCDKYTRHCQKCGVLGSDKVKDLSFRVFQRKIKTYAKIKNMTIIGVSKWLAGCAQNSVLFRNRKIVCLPNPLNTNVFKPMDKTQARVLWNLPSDKKLVLFGAVSATSTPYKGFDLLVKALDKITIKNIEFIVFGASEPTNPPKFS